MSQINWQLVSEEKVRNLEDLKIFSKRLADSLPSQTVVALSGPMAAGKTELVKMFAEQWGIHDVSSPTFALHQHYSAGGRDIEHLDLFRIDSEDELESAGFWDLFVTSQQRVIFIEWPEKMRLWQIPQSWALYQIIYDVSENLRTLRISKR